MDEHCFMRALFRRLHRGGFASLRGTNSHAHFYDGWLDGPRANILETLTATGLIWPGFHAPLDDLNEARARMPGLTCMARSD